jgi:hypothetical protein
MKRGLIGTLAATLLPVLAMAQQPTPAPAAQVAPTAGPVIQIVEKIKDFGTVPKGEKIKAVFEVRNTGKAPLEISQVRPTCGCTVANFDRTIAPGGSGKVEAEVDTTGFAGPISKAVLVFSNDPAAPQTNLVIKADVRSFIDVVPRPLISFVNVLQGEAATDKLKLVATDEADWKIESVDTGGGPYKVTYRPLADNERVPERKGSQWELAVTVPADAKEGILNQSLKVKTTSAKAPEVTIRIAGNVRAPVQVLPAEINFGTVTSEALIGQNVVVINNRRGTEMQITEAKLDNPAFSAEVIPLQAGQRYQVAVTMKVGTPKGAQKATLKLSTSDPARKLISVPVQALVQ